MHECKKILYAEDEEDIRAITRLSLEDIGGFELVVCNNGSDVLQMMKKFKPDLLLLDVMMPGMDGAVTLSEIKKQHQFKDIPVIFMTARAQPGEVKQYLEMGAIGVIIKPFDPMKLANEIKEIWKNHHEQ